MENITQIALVTGFYRCQYCGRDADRVQKVRRFRLCDDCWEEIVAPTVPGIAIADYDSDEHRARIRFWNWYGEMEKRYPTGTVWHPRKKFEPPDIAAFWPYCRRCGAKTTEYEFGTKRSLFGRHREAYCPVCDAKNGVESVARMADGGIVHSDWDDEDWLDLLWKSQREAFDLGVLPAYWFELRRQVGEAGLPSNYASTPTKTSAR